MSYERWVVDMAWEAGMFRPSVIHGCADGQ